MATSRTPGGPVQARKVRLFNERYRIGGHGRINWELEDYERATEHSDRIARHYLWCLGVDVRAMDWAMKP